MKEEFRHFVWWTTSLLLALFAELFFQSQFGVENIGVVIMIYLFYAGMQDRKVHAKNKGGK